MLPIFLQKRNVWRPLFVLFRRIAVLDRRNEHFPCPAPICEDHAHLALAADDGIADLGDASEGLGSETAHGVRARQRLLRPLYPLLEFIQLDLSIYPVTASFRTLV